MLVALNQTNVFVPIRVLKDADGTPKTDMDAATSGQEIWFWRYGAAAIVTDSGSAADMSALDDAHTDWEFLHIHEGDYWTAFPDAAFLEGVGSVKCGINATGFTGITETVIIEPLYKFQGQADSVTALTTTFPANTDPNKGDFIYAVSDTGIKQMVMITSVSGSGSGQVATHEAWPRTNISATTTTILLIAGNGGIMADGGINVDALISSRSTLDSADINVEMDAAITDNFNFTGGNVDGNVVKVAGGLDLKKDGTGNQNIGET